MAEIPLAYEEVKTMGDLNEARFGHTITSINPQMAILFGGAIGNNSKFDLANDTYLFSVFKLSWTKLRPQGTLPSPRAAHAATRTENLQLVVYGGAAKGTSRTYGRRQFSLRRPPPPRLKAW